MFLFWGYNFMSAGIATTLHFTYPVFVTLIMLLFFREKTPQPELLTERHTDRKRATDRRLPA